MARKVVVDEDKLDARSFYALWNNDATGMRMDGTLTRAMTRYIWEAKMPEPLVARGWTGGVGKLVDASVMAPRSGTLCSAEDAAEDRRIAMARWESMEAARALLARVAGPINVAPRMHNPTVNYGVEGVPSLVSASLPSGLVLPLALHPDMREPVPHEGTSLYHTLRFADDDLQTAFVEWCCEVTRRMQQCLHVRAFFKLIGSSPVAKQTDTSSWFQVFPWMRQVLLMFGANSSALGERSIPWRGHSNITARLHSADPGRTLAMLGKIGAEGVWPTLNKIALLNRDQHQMPAYLHPWVPVTPYAGWYGQHYEAMHGTLDTYQGKPVFEREAASSALGGGFVS